MFQQHHPCQLVGERHGGHGQPQICPLLHRISQSVGTADQKCDGTVLAALCRLFQLDEDPQRAERVQKRVLQKLDEPVESEEIAMKPKMTFRRIRPLIFAAAAVAVGAVSLITANAATGGELFSKLSIYLNGKKQDYDVELVSQDDSQITYKIKDGTVTYTRMAGDVQFFDVDFGYVPEKIVLHDVSLYAKPGEKVAFVGATGAGKTTITNLINRFYDLADGKIRYDGININKIKKADLRRSLGIVLQDVNLFTGTVMDNIRYGRLDATDEECIAAAKRANAHHFIMLLPDGYQTVLSGDGSGLSQGQRQLLSIARAAVADPPVMILDEATSSIDTRTERIVQAGMDALMHGRTVFVIAHRLSTIQNSDVIMVLDHGRIIERGSHEKLMAEKGRYYLLYTGMQQNA